MKARRIICLLLALVMITTVTPLFVFSSPQTAVAAISLGAGVLQSGVNTANAATVYYGDEDYAWRVVGYNGEGVASEKDALTLLASGNMDQTFFSVSESGYNNKYADSLLYSKILDIEDSFNVSDRYAIARRTLAKGAYDGYKTDCIADIEKDYQYTLSKCRQVTPETIKNETLYYKVLGGIMKIIAPLL